MLVMVVGFLKLRNGSKTQGSIDSQKLGPVTFSEMLTISEQ